MSFLFAATLAAAVQPTCSWDHPGRNPYTGSTAAAIDRYTDIPEAVRSTLKRRVDEAQPDDNVSITRDSIGGKSHYNPAIRDMHFGASSVCSTVTRSKWAADRSEPGAVYCVGEHCILVPKICGNVSRITRTSASTAAAGQQPAYASTELMDAASAQEFAALSAPELGLNDAPPTLDESPDTMFVSPEDMDNAMRRGAAERRRGALASLLGDLSFEEMLTEMELDPDELARRQALLRGNGNGVDGILLGDTQTAQPVPEAETWAMLLAGLGLVGWQARRRTRKQA